MFLSVVRAVLVIGMLNLSGCAYNIGFGGRSLPQGYSYIAVPIFSNVTFEPGIEVEFTNSMIQEIERSGVARVVDKSRAEVVLLGTLHSMKMKAGGIESPKDETYKFKLPEGSAISRTLELRIYLKLELVRKSDKKIIWAGNLEAAKTYDRPNITIPVLNSANPLYDLSERRSTLKLMAQDVSSEAFDRLTERF